VARDFAKKFYNSRLWKDNVRPYIIKRDNYKCKQCGSSIDLEVHHIIHLSPDNINDPNITVNERNLITLCRDCHFKVHEQDKIKGIVNKNKFNIVDEGFCFDEKGYLIKIIPPTT
jgi:Restriction endonuclease